MTIAVQIDTTLYRSKIGVSHGFQRFDHPFNRTVVVRQIKKCLSCLAERQITATILRDMLPKLELGE